jgi:glycine/D-amino acid oxidase-like deaminating enzyme
MIIVIGAGLFGSMATALARKAGYEVCLIDNNSPYAASRCSGNLFKPSWLDSLGAEKSEIAYKTLHYLFNVQKVECALRPLLNKIISLDWVDPAESLLRPDLKATVQEVSDGYVRTVEGKKISGRVLVAAGVWSEELVAMPKIKRLMGASLRIRGQVKQPSIYMWAPYKHAVAYNITENEIWAGDGAAIIAKNWTAERVDSLRNHATKFFGVHLKPGHFEVREGARPYVEGFKQGFFARVAPRTWVSTGGAKNGAILAAYQAAQFVEGL